MYENTDARSHRMAADLIEAGVNVHDIYRRLYERVPVEKLRLISRALEKIERYADCGLAITYIEAEDYEATGASEVLTEGIIDYVRSIEGTAVAAFVRDKTDGGRAARKVSLRATEEVDVSAIAREHGGGGHRRAAGFSTDLAYPELVELLCAQFARSGATVPADLAPAAVLLCDKPAGVTSHDVVAPCVASAASRRVTAARSTRSPRGCWSSCSAAPPACSATCSRCRRPTVATARLGWTSTTGDPDGELTETGRVPERLELPTGRIAQRVPLTSAVRVDGERLYKRAHRGETTETPEREVEVHRAELLEAGEGRARFEIECSSGTYIRTLIRPSTTPTARSCAAPRSGRSRSIVPRTSRSRPTRRSRSCPSARSTTPRPPTSRTAARWRPQTRPTGRSA